MSTSIDYLHDLPERDITGLVEILHILQKRWPEPQSETLKRILTGEIDVGWELFTMRGEILHLRVRKLNGGAYEVFVKIKSPAVSGGISTAQTVVDNIEYGRARFMLAKVPPKIIRKNVTIDKLSKIEQFDEIRVDKSLESDWQRFDQKHGINSKEWI